VLKTVNCHYLRSTDANKINFMFFLAFCALLTFVNIFVLVMLENLADILSSCLGDGSKVGHHELQLMLSVVCSVADNHSSCKVNELKQ